MDAKQNVDIFSMEVRSYRAAACLYTAKENLVACSHEPVCFADNTATLYMCMSVGCCVHCGLPTQEGHVNQSYCAMRSSGCCPGTGVWFSP